MSAASLTSFCDVFRLAQVDDMGGGVDLVRRAQPLGQRLQLIAAAGGEHEVAAFLGEGFGGGRANALGGAGDQDALAAQMQIHGISRLLGDVGIGVGGIGRRRLPIGGQHCTAALRRGAVWSIARPSNKRRYAATARAQGIPDEQRKKTYRIAVIPGDGIGKEVVPEGLRVLEAAAKKHGVAVHFDHFDFAS